MADKCNNLATKTQKGLFDAMNSDKQRINNPMSATEQPEFYTSARSHREGVKSALAGYFSSKQHKRGSRSQGRPRKRPKRATVRSTLYDRSNNGI